MVMPPDDVLRKKGRGCFARGCLVSFVLLLGVVIIGAGLWLRVPQKLGIWPSADVLWSNEPDRGAATAMLSELTAGGMDATGLRLYVLPVANSEDVIAYAVLDTSKGFRFPSGSDRPAILDFFVRIGSSSTATAEGIDHVGLEYRDETGATIGVLTATPETIAAYARGELTDKQFGAAVAGWVEPGFITSGVEQ